MKFQIHIAQNRKQYYYVLVARNGEILVTSEMFESKQAAFKGIRAVRKSLFAPTYDMTV